MKGQLYIGDSLASETVEFVQPVHEGDLIIFQEQSLRVRGVGHNVDKKKLRVVCFEPAKRQPKPTEPSIDTSNLGKEMVDLLKGDLAEPIAALEAFLSVKDGQKPTEPESAAVEEPVAPAPTAPVTTFRKGRRR